MPSVSVRAREAYRSPIRELEDVAAAARARGTHVHHLNIGQPDLPTPPAAWRALERAGRRGAGGPGGGEADGVLAYGPARGLPSYRAALVDYYARWGVRDLDVEHVNVTTGASEALWLAINAVADPGDEVVVPEPFYALYNGLLELGDVAVSPVPTYLAEAFALPGAAQIEAAVTPRTRAILLCNPNNPTGQVYDRATLERIAAVAARHDLYVIVDEVYREFVYEGTFTSALAVEALRERAVVIDSVSKRYSACGARIGSVTSRDAELMLAITRLGRFRLCPPTLGQVMCEAILRDDADYLAASRREYARRRRVLYEGLTAIPGVRAYLPQGAFYCFAELPVADAEAFARWLLTDFSHEGATVMLAPGAGFYATPGRGASEVRIAYVLAETKLGAALACLRAALRVYPTAKPYSISNQLVAD